MSSRLISLQCDLPCHSRLIILSDRVLFLRHNAGTAFVLFNLRSEGGLGGEGKKCNLFHGGWCKVVMCLKRTGSSGLRLELVYSRADREASWVVLTVPTLSYGACAREECNNCRRQVEKCFLFYPSRLFDFSLGTRAEVPGKL